MPANDAELVSYEVDRGIALITLCSPENRNALSQQLTDQLGRYVDQAIRDTSILAALLSAEGDVFSAGADLKEKSGQKAETSGGERRFTVAEICTLMMHSDLPFVAAINGPVRAGATALVASCDIAIAQTRATFAIPEVSLGLVPAVVVVPMMRVVNERALRRYLLTGEVFGPDEAARIGLISEATEHLDTNVEKVLDGLRRGHPAALRRVKAIIGELRELDTVTAFRFTMELSAAWFASPDGQEGIRARLEKRDPTWRTY